MKRILYLSFYFEPDLCAGSFRNSPLIKELGKQVEGKAILDVITTLPNRYSSFHADAPEFEERGNINIHRIAIPKHKSGMLDQILSFKKYFSQTKSIIESKKYDLVVASSSRLFTAYLGYSIAKAQNIPLYLDIRDIFTDTMKDVIKSNTIKTIALPVLRAIEKKVFNYATHINLISEGFKQYFRKFPLACYTYYPNGIDDIFLNLPESKETYKKTKTITYAGNFGEGQGLHKVVPQAATLLGNDYKFLLIGDGGAKNILNNELKRLNVANVEVRDPMKRNELLKVYEQSDFLFIHLNDYDAFKKVLPSKIFELAAYDKPLIAGVAGFANEFIAQNVSNKILFLPGDIHDLVRQLKKYVYHNEVRTEFIKKFKRKNINENMAMSIVKYL